METEHIEHKFAQGKRRLLQNSQYEQLSEKSGWQSSWSWLWQCGWLNVLKLVLSISDFSLLSGVATMDHWGCIFDVAQLLCWIPFLIRPSPIYQWLGSVPYFEPLATLPGKFGHIFFSGLSWFWFLHFLHCKRMLNTSKICNNFLWTVDIEMLSCSYCVMPSQRL